MVVSHNRRRCRRKLLALLYSQGYGVDALVLLTGLSPSGVRAILRTEGAMPASKSARRKIVASSFASKN